MSNEVWDDGKSIVKALYKASGNPATRPALPAPTFAKPAVQSGDLTGKAGQTENTLNEGTNGTPGIVVFNNVLYAVYESLDKSNKPTGRIWYTSFKSDNWDSPKLTPTPEIKDENKKGYGTTGAPALIVLGDTLYAFHEGFAQNRQLWLATAKLENGNLSWKGDNNTNFGTTGAPALAIYKNGDKDEIYCVHLGKDGQSLWWARHDGKNWTQSDTQIKDRGAAARPSLAAARSSLCVWDNKLYCVFQGTNNGEFWYVVYDNKTKDWTNGNKTAYATYGAPGLAAYNNKLYAFHEGYTGAAGEPPLAPTSAVLPAPASERPLVLRLAALAAP